MFDRVGHETSRKRLLAVTVAVLLVAGVVAVAGPGAAQEQFSDESGEQEQPTSSEPDIETSIDTSAVLDRGPGDQFEVGVERGPGNPDGTAVPTVAEQETDAESAARTAQDGVGDSEAFFTLSDLAPQSASVQKGATVEVSVLVENVGDAEGTQQITLEVGNVTDSVSLTLAAGGSEAVSLAIDTSSLSPGDYVHTVSSNDSGVAGELTVEALPDPASFQIVSLEPPAATVTQGEEVAIDVAIQNMGDIEATRDITLEIGAFSRTKSLTLGGGEAGAVSFDVDTSDIESGNYTHLVATDDDSVTGEFRVERPAEFQIAAFGPVDTAVEQGTVVDVNVTVQNAGDLGDTQAVTLEVGSVTSETSVSLDGGDADEVSFTVDTSAIEPADYSYTVATANDNETGTLVVQGPPVFTVDSVSTPTTDERAVTINATIQNVGDREGAGEVVLAIDGTNRTETESLTLASGETDSVSFTVDTSDLDPGTYTYTVSTDDEAKSEVPERSLTVEQVDSDEDGFGPGLGVGTAIVALCVAGYAVRRRRE